MYDYVEDMLQLFIFVVSKVMPTCSSNNETDFLPYPLSINCFSNLPLLLLIHLYMYMSVCLFILYSLCTCQLRLSCLSVYIKMFIVVIN